MAHISLCVSRKRILEAVWPLIQPFLCLKIKEFWLLQVVTVYSISDFFTFCFCTGNFWIATFNVLGTQPWYFLYHLKKTFGPILNAHHYLQQHSCSNCSTISNIDCCPQQCHTTTNTNNRNHKPSKCQLFDDIGMTIKEYHNGQKWLEQCQECECLVSERNP